LRTAYEKKIPTFYLWDENLVQYGYGRQQVRGIATTFDGDSNLDSAFTTRKDDCKSFLAALGFPVPQGQIVTTLKEALIAAEEIGYPVVLKPVAGHKGIGVTANIKTAEDLEFAFVKALQAISEAQPTDLILEKFIVGTDFRLLCVDGKFVAATERRPAAVTGDGRLTIQELIHQENATEARLDTPTSPLGKIEIDDGLRLTLAEQGLSLESIPARGAAVTLRKVANLSAGGISFDATASLHPDNIVLAQDIAQHFRLVCLGIDVIADRLDRSWREGHLGIIEINAAPGVFMHLKPAVGASVDVPAHILNTLYPNGGSDARIPLLTFNRITLSDLSAIVDHVLDRYPHWVVGAVCRQGILINRSEKILNPEYNSNVRNLLRNPKLDLLIAEYAEPILEREGMFYQGSNLVVLDNPSEVELMLGRDLLENSTVIIKHGSSISVQSKGLMEQYRLGLQDSFQRVYLQQIAKIL
jgi:cyanophycin synthetase